MEKLFLLNLVWWGKRMNESQQNLTLKEEFYKRSSQNLPSGIIDEYWYLYEVNQSNNRKSNLELFEKYIAISNNSELTKILLNLSQIASRSANFKSTREYSHLSFFIKSSCHPRSRVILKAKDIKKMKTELTDKTRNLIKVLKSGIVDPVLSDLIYATAHKSLGSKVSKNVFINSAEIATDININPLLSELLEGVIYALELKEPNYRGENHDTSILRINTPYINSSKLYNTYDEYLIFERALFHHCEGIFGRIPDEVQHFYIWFRDQDGIKFPDSKDGLRDWDLAKSVFRKYKKNNKLPMQGHFS
jgi:hypothetical protein